MTTEVHPDLLGTIPISFKDWANFAANQNEEFSLVYYGSKPGSSLTRQLVTRRKSDRVIFVAETYEIFSDDTEWIGDVPFARLYPATADIAWKIP